MKRLSDPEMRAMLTAEQCGHLGRFADIQARLDEPLVLTVVALRACGYKVVIERIEA